MSVCYSEQTDANCPNCRNSINCKVWLVVDGTECPELLERVRAGSIHRISCSSCNHSFQINEPLFLYRASNTPSLVFSPSENIPEKSYSAQLNQLASRLPKSIKTKLNNLSVITEAPTVERPFLPFISINLHEATKLLGPLSRLLQSSTLELAQRVIEQHPDLLTRDTFIVLDGNISGARACGDKLYERNLSDYRSVLLRCQEVGISNAFDELVNGTGSVAVPFHQILFRFLDAQTNREAMLIADTYPVLLTEESLRIFQDYIAIAEADKNEDAVADLREGLLLLHDLRRTTSLLRPPLSAHSRSPHETNQFIAHSYKVANAEITVSSSSYDEILLRAKKRKSEIEVTVFNFDDLLNKLNSEDKSHYVYRGQNRIFSPLMPSLYRPLIDASGGFERNNITSLYNRGRYFYQTLTNVTPVDHFRRQFSFGKALLGLFGLPFGMFFAQHCCVPTEGLDVTQDPQIAGLFSIYDYANAHYFDAFDEPGVIYRVTVSHTRFHTLEDIKCINDFSLPFYLDGTTILGLIEECATIEEAISAYREFQFEDCYLKTQKTDIELENYRFHRPLEILRMPPWELAQGRIFKQKAGLIFPDLIFEKRFDSHPAENEGIPWQGTLCVEDLSKAECVETFVFRHSDKNKQVIHLDPDLLFPTKDPIKSMLSRVFTGLFGTRLLNWDRKQAVTLSAGDEDSLIR